MHLIALHTHGSNNPLGITGNLDRIPFHPYFVFKDLVTVLFFILALSFFIFYAPNVLGHQWPIIVLLIVNTINICAISWKYILIKILVKIHNGTIRISDYICTTSLFNFVLFTQTENASTNNPSSAKILYALNILN
jgi:quinol-cytochrome oxidoreductase complex cytochrome b subunit